MKKLMLIAGVLTACLGAHGADVYWSNAGTGNWTTESNWQGGALPGVNDTAINDSGGTILFSDGMEQTVKYFHEGRSSGKTGHLQITGGKLTLVAVASQIGSVAGGGGTVEMTGGELHVGQFQVGAHGTGSMILSGGTVYSKDWSCIGRYPGGVGTLTITGSGVWECQALSVFASEQGTGTITIENGGELRFAPTNTREFVIGNQASGVGVLRVNTGGTLKVNGVDARYATDKFILDGGTFVRMSAGDNANFIHSQGGGGKFQIGPNGGTIDTSTGTQTVTIDIDDLPGSSGGTLVKKGTGTLVLSKGGTFTGGFTVQEGTLSVAQAANLPGCTTAPITIKSGATLKISGDWTEEAFTAMTNRADFVVEEGGTLVAPAAFTTDYVVSVPSGTLTLSGLNITARLVKTGPGTLELAGYNALGGGVVVSNGTLAANYETSGLADTHVHLAGPSTTAYCYLGIHGDSFTAPIAASGAGTFSFGPYTGIKAMDPGPFTLNIGGDGHTIAWPADGDWLFGPNGGPFTVKNPLSANGKSNFTLKNTGTSWPIVLEGGITNNSTTAGVLNYWTGPVILPARAGGARHESYRFYLRSGDILFTNATIHSVNDFIVGGTDANSGVARVTFKNCVKTKSGGWDYINGSTGTVVTIDGGSYAAPSRLCVGRSDSGKTGRLVITNNAAVTTSEFYMQSGSLEIDSGSLTANSSSVIGDGNVAWAGRGPVSVTQRGGKLTFNTSATVGSQTGSVARVVMSGGSMFMKDGGNFQVGARGNGTLIQTGGDISMCSYPCVGRYPGGVGEYRLHGGTFTHRDTANGSGCRFFVAEDGTGTVSIANGGRLTVTNAGGVCIASKAGSKGTPILSPGGTFEATTAYGGAGDDTFVFNGGTFKMLSNAKASTFIQSSVNRRVATPLGGAIDTAGKGDFTLPVALTAASRPEELSETLIHRWRFDDGSLADCVGNSDATVSGTVAWTDGAVRMSNAKCGTSCINLGTDMLPTDGRGATVEFWVTPRSVNSWARLFDFGAINGQEMYFTFKNNNAFPQLCINGVTSKAGTVKFEMDKMYYVALVVDPQLDGSIIFTIHLHDGATGARLDEIALHAPATWKMTTINQANGCWLGHSAFAADNDPGADYHDVRVYNRAMTADQLAASCAAGPDAHFYLMKKGAGMLTLTGANTYKAGTGVDGGTLTLASGATLPATEMWAGAGATLKLNTTAQTARELGGSGTVKDGTLAVTGTIQPGGRHAIGTLTVNGTTLTSGTLVIDAAADGTSDCLAATGTLDLSNFSLKLGDANLNEDRVYTLVTAAEVTGKFRDEELPNRWRTYVQPTKVTFAYANGTVMLVR